MAIQTPTINQIIKMNEFDLMRTKIKKFNMYMCLDSQRLYYDSTDAESGRIPYSYIGVKTVNDLLYNITPAFGKTYYCWEDNSLWLWMNKWVTIWSQNEYPSAYQYTDWNGSTGSLNNVYRFDEPLMPADDNGLLHDGSVIVRDRLRIIKGRLYIDDGNDNLVISSYLGGGIRFLPNGLMDLDGELFISDEGKSFLRSELTVKNDEIYVDYSEKPTEDRAIEKLKKDSHRYKVYHEGNLDASLIKPLTGEAVYNALIADKNKLPNPFEFNVKQLDGLGKDDYAKTEHTHTADQITDFNTKAQAQADIVFKSNMNSAVGQGITIQTQTDTQPLKFVANNFRITLAGGVTGNALVSHLTDTQINVVVDPDEHIHQDLVDDIAAVNTRINNLDIMDRKDYYTKYQIDTMLDDIKPTDVATPGKALKVNEDGILPVGVITAQKLDVSKHIELTGDITGSVDTDFQNDTITINTDSSNILSSVATPGKALTVDNDGNLPVNSTSASKLNHNITVTLKKEVSGTAILDTSLNTFEIDCTLVPGNNILQDKDLNILVPEMEDVGTDGNHDYKIKMENIPDVLKETVIKPQGMFDPTTGVPSTSPKEGYIWIANKEGIIDGEIILPEDEYLYSGGQWHLISGNQNVISVNGYQGRVTLTYSDVNAISDTYIDYDITQPVPQGKIVIATKNGEAEGVTIPKLTNKFSLLTDSTGDIEINTTDSIAIDTDGSNDLNVKLDITQTGYQNILDTIGYVLQENGVDLTHRKKLNFSNVFTIDKTTDTDTYGLSLIPELNAFNWYFIDINTLGTLNSITVQQQKDDITKFYEQRNDKPTILVLSNTSTNWNLGLNNTMMYLIDSSLPEPTTGTQIEILPINKSNDTVYDNSYITTIFRWSKLILTFNVNEFGELTFDNGRFSDWSSKIQTLYTTTPMPNTINESDIVPFMPTKDYQPTSKKYVDSRFYKTTIGDGSNKAYVITHNLNSTDIIVQFRDNLGHQVYIDNAVVDENNLAITTSSKVLQQDEISVYIIKMN